MEGYEHVAKDCPQHDEGDSFFSQILSVVPKFVTDSNAAAQQTGVEAALAFVENAGVKMTAKVAEQIANGVATKCVAAMKSATKVVFPPRCNTFQLVPGESP